MTFAVRLAAVAGLLLLGLNAGLAFAHALERPNKPRLAPEVWLVVQEDLYDGWGAAIVPTLAVAAVLLGVFAWAVRGRPRGLAAAALAFVLVSEAGVWPAMVRPTNLAVDAWEGARPPGNWRALRDSWETGHYIRFWLLTAAFGLAAGAVVTAAARRHPTEAV